MGTKGLSLTSEPWGQFDCPGGGGMLTGRAGRGLAELTAASCFVPPANGACAADVKSHLQKFRLKAHKRAQLQAAEAEATAVAVAGSPRPTKAGRAGGGVASTGSLPAGLSAAVLPNNMVPITTAGAGEAFDPA